MSHFLLRNFFPIIKFSQITLLCILIYLFIYKQIPTAIRPIASEYSYSIMNSGRVEMGRGWPKKGGKENNEGVGMEWKQ